MSKEQTTVEGLLKDRYKVIAPNGYHYPNSPFLDGEILMQQNEGVWLVSTKDGINSFYDRHPENYPNLFRKLSWWEERFIDDKYMKWQFGSFGRNDFLPSTEQEYNEYLTKR